MRLINRKPIYLFKYFFKCFDLKNFCRGMGCSNFDLVILRHIGFLELSFSTG